MFLIKKNCLKTWKIITNMFSQSSFNNSASVTDDLGTYLNSAVNDAGYMLKTALDNNGSSIEVHNLTLENWDLVGDITLYYLRSSYLCISVMNRLQFVFIATHFPMSKPTQTRSGSFSGINWYWSMRTGLSLFHRSLSWITCISCTKLAVDHDAVTRKIACTGKGQTKNWVSENEWKHQSKCSFSENEHKESQDLGRFRRITNDQCHT